MIKSDMLIAAEREAALKSQAMLRVSSATSTAATSSRSSSNSHGDGLKGIRKCKSAEPPLPGSAMSLFDEAAGVLRSRRVAAFNKSKQQVGTESFAKKSKRKKSKDEAKGVKAKSKKKRGESSDEEPPFLDILLKWESVKERVNLRVLEDALREGADVNDAHEDFNWTALTWAASKGNVVLAKFLLKHSANVNTVCSASNTPLSTAAKSGKMNVAMVLLEARASMEIQTDEGFTPLMWASMNGHEEVATLLVDANASLGRADQAGRTACMWAARHWHVPIVGLIVAAGIDVDIEDKDGFTVMDHAQEHVGLRDALNAARERNRRLVDASLNNDLREVQEALEEGAYVDCAVGQEHTLLETAKREKNVELVRLLRRFGAGYNAERSVAHATCPDVENVAEAGVQADATKGLIKQALDATDRLLLAAEKGDWEEAEECIMEGAYVDARNGWRMSSALMAAGKLGSVTGIDLLALANANLDACDYRGWTSVHFAVASDCLDAVSALHFYGAEMICNTYDGSNCIHVAAEANCPQMVQLLVAAHVDPNRRTVVGLYPIQVASMYGCAESLTTLMCCKADPDVKDEQMRSVLALAAIFGQTKSIKALFEKVAQPPKMPSSVEPIEPPKKEKKEVDSGLDKIEEDDEEGEKPKTEKKPELPPVEEKKPSKDDSGWEKAKDILGLPKSNKKKKVKLSPEQKLRNKYGANLLIGFAAGLHKEFCEIWVGKLPDHGLDRKDVDGCLPLHLAVIAQRPKAIMQFLDKKADVNCPDSEYNTPLMYAAQSGNEEIVEILLQADANSDRKNNAEMKALDLCTDNTVQRKLLRHMGETAAARQNSSAKQQPALVLNLDMDPEAEDDDQSGFRVRFDQLPILPEDMLRDFIVQFMKKYHVFHWAWLDIPLHPITQKPRGWAKAKFGDERLAKLVCSGDGDMIYGNAVQVSRSYSPRRAG